MCNLNISHQQAMDSICYQKSYEHTTEFCDICGNSLMRKQIQPCHGMFEGRPHAMMC